VVFGKLLSAFGVGGPSADTVLTHAHVLPGAVLHGQVNLVGGKSDAQITSIIVGLVARMEVEGGEEEHSATVEFHRARVSGALTLAAGQQMAVPFSVTVPWEAPITEVLGQHLHGMTVGVHTEVEIAGAMDKTDLDQVHIGALPSQQAILDAFARLGFGFKAADLEQGHIAGAGQTLPFYQEIEFYPSAQHAGAISELELTFVTSPHQITVVIEFNKRGGMFSAGHDGISTFVITHDAAQGDLTAVVDGWLRQALDRHASHSSHGSHHGHGHASHDSQHDGHDSHHGSHGGGLGAAAGGLAVGLAGGYVAGEVLDEVFEDDEEEFADFEEE
jgi:sporulation-control protein